MNRKCPMESLPQTPSTIDPQRSFPRASHLVGHVLTCSSPSPARLQDACERNQQRVSPLLKTKNNKTHAPVSRRMVGKL